MPALRIPKKYFFMYSFLVIVFATTLNEALMLPRDKPNKAQNQRHCERPCRREH